MTKILKYNIDDITSVETVLQDDEVELFVELNQLTEYQLSEPSQEQLISASAAESNNRIVFKLTGRR